jgi:hypothetical protein
MPSRTMMPRSSLTVRRRAWARGRARGSRPRSWRWGVRRRGRGLLTKSATTAAPVASPPQMVYRRGTAEIRFRAGADILLCPAQFVPPGGEHRRLTRSLTAHQFFDIQNALLENETIAGVSRARQISDILQFSSLICSVRATGDDRD